MTEAEVSALTIGKRDLIVLHVDVDDETSNDMIAMLHKHFPANMILMLNPGETIESQDEETVKSVLKALLDHQEYRDHLELAQGELEPDA